MKDKWSNLHDKSIICMSYSFRLSIDRVACRAYEGDRIVSSFHAYQTSIAGDAFIACCHR